MKRLGHRRVEPYGDNEKASRARAKQAAMKNDAEQPATQPLLDIAVDEACDGPHLWRVKMRDQEALYLRYDEMALLWRALRVVCEHATEDD